MPKWEKCWSCGTPHNKCHVNDNIPPCCKNCRHYEKEKKKKEKDKENKR